MAGVTSLPVYPQRLRERSPSRAVEATVYPSGGGTPYTGYVIDGRTYKDPQGVTRIDSGSTVELRDGRSYVYHASQSSGVPTAMSAMTEYKNAMDAAADELRGVGRRNDYAVSLATQATRSELEQQKRAARAQAQADEKALYKDWLQAQNPYGLLAQRNTALGLGDSGYAETTLANLNAGYMQGLSGIRSDLSSTLADLDSKITRAYLDGEIEKVRYWEQLERDILDFTAQSRNKLLDTSIDAAEAAVDGIRLDREWQQKLADAQFDREKWQTELEYEKQQDAQDAALALIKLGLSSQEIADALGITPAQAQQAAWRAVNGKSSGSSKSTSKTTSKTTSKSTSKPAPTVAEQKAYYQKLMNRLNILFEDEGIRDEAERERYVKDAVQRAVDAGHITQEYAHDVGIYVLKQ